MFCFQAALVSSAASVVGLGSDICGSGRLPVSYTHLMLSTNRAELVNNDPVLCCLYFEKLVSTFINAFKKPNGVLGDHYVVDYFKHIKFQHRGSPHCHTLLWLNNAPTRCV